MITFVKLASFKNVLWVLDTLDTWTIWITGYFLWDRRIISLNKPKRDNIVLDFLGFEQQVVELINVQNV